MKQELVSVLNGNAFAMGDAQGDMEADPCAPIGLFSFDTRFLSHWVLTVDGERLQALSRDDLTYFETRFVLVPGTASHYVDADVSVIRHRSIDEAFDERITVLNHSARPAEFTVRMEIGSDFADTAEILRPVPREPVVVADTDGRQLRIRYERGRFTRETYVSSTAPVEVDGRGMTFRIRIEPDGQWQTDLHVGMVIHGAGGRDLRADIESHRQHVREGMRDDLRHWFDQAPHLVADRAALGAAYRQALADLAALRYTPLAYTDRVPVGGLPWAMTLYGRDALVTCLETLAFTPELTPATLRMLALLQGGQLDDYHDEEPGKILSELRYGEAAAFDEQPTALYYGAADTTPLFVVLLDEYERWTGDADLVRQLRHPARMALDWLTDYGDPYGDGYLRYQPRNTVNGVANQTWRNSPDAIVDRTGVEPPFPRATCELQGYAYDARVRGARLAREFWDDPEYAEQLEADAARLRERFNRDFWLPHRGYYALALTPDGEPVDALTSGLGHLLWSGIVEPDRADALAAHLCGPDLFSGWGVRTYADGQRPYNPVGAHLGAVWPSDNALVAAGLRRYGFDAEAAQIAAGVFAAAETLGGSVPEVIAGYPRALTKYPVQLPAAGRPQSWASGGLLMLLSTMLGLRPCGENLLVDPAIPTGYGRIELLDVPGRWGRTDSYGRERGSGRRARVGDQAGVRRAA
ncbi:Glycogen debranching enzyme (alpha-1,6-glucosidase) [Micromonospora sediminicola]|uniref:Glycogen debranching enzyme (Alpha-1,6-glucosidase) n=1 Tax=Micromonospora sediminicola TaxID=946078 RepID=A0A1A9BES7_9ACTN|nr:glycogen debranching N-terminal domain-containing protein [Micromonospora sediminicola]SBT67678.1 Glycogen debranching enzyme (alpha-1,6-glucosidase) [Micromonospora sediminicola]